MSKELIYLERTLAILQIVIGGVLIYGIYQSIMADAFYSAREYGDIVGDKVSPRFHWEFVRYQQEYILAILCLLGGILWLFNKRTGWVVSYSFWLSYFLFIVSYLLVFVLHGGWTIFGLFISKMHWIAVIGIVALVSLDLHWHRLF